MAKVALKVYRYRYRHHGKSLFTYRLLTELKIPLPYISGPFSTQHTTQHATQHKHSTTLNKTHAQYTLNYHWHNEVLSLYFSRLLLPDVISFLFWRDVGPCPVLGPTLHI